MPDGVYLATLEQTADSVKMSGFSESNNRISALMRNLDTSHKYEESNLTKVQQDTTLGDQGSVFDLQIKIEQPGSAVSLKLLRLNTIYLISMTTLINL